jgi:membrane-associated protease RseP (regulator of RpoE activity)
LEPSQHSYDPIPAPRQPYGERITVRKVLVHSALFFATFITCSLAGFEFTARMNSFPEFFTQTVPEGFFAVIAAIFTHPDFGAATRDGMTYAVLLLTFLGVHEFGHYFAARFHKVDTSLPWFIPMPLLIGTMGAVIRIRSFIASSRVLFDIGVAGPIAGFVVSILILVYGFSTMPGPEYILGFGGHEQVQAYVIENGVYPESPSKESAGQTLVLGNTLLFSLLASFFDNVPPMFELYHYPWLFVGWLGLFFTALNLMPLGQLDGGHVIYAMFGPRVHAATARVFLVILSVFAGAGVIPVAAEELKALGVDNMITPWLVWLALLFFILNRAFNADHRFIAPSLAGSLLATFLLLRFHPTPQVSSGMLMWLLWMTIGVFLIKIDHPPVVYLEPLTPRRRALGWLSIVIFVLCISPNPIYTL